VVLAGTAGFHFIFGWQWLDAFYMVVTTLTTIGYQEIHPLSSGGRVFNLALIFFVWHWSSSRSGRSRKLC